ncbi:protein involved in polysaccharide export, contains SLBB domain of the beta-grasp fold [Spirosoma endophyticum]|uniref:Protein involved in polysaccharide export, contains SLBB domain of the beta-grasp fold n=1 Tax=Spirosoma endophyticum TaxID=662367 RepID=A0A1I2FX35_9BACT|nr:protein involved in polysaccharide export, contains SLBB domain of the beta-grasp fold [Spirosoma endophyticum]
MIRRTLIIILLMLYPLWGGYNLLLAQAVNNLTDEQVTQFVQQARISGMTETQMEALALTRGFTPADINRMRQRISQLQPSSGRPTTTPETNVVREQPATPSPPATTTAAASTPAVFGASLFTSVNLSFEPNLRMPTPRNYIIGPDDELIIDVYGNAQQTYRPRVSPEGSIRIENLSPIYVNGLTIEQAEQRVIGRLKTLYQGINTSASGVQAQVTLGSVRSIKVTLLGQVVRPGTYTLSSLATVFNALYAAGGPAPGRGSFRDIRVYRSNRLVRTLDCYDFLLRADQKDNIRLLDQDIIFVDHYGTHIELAGEVKQPGLYEMRRGETLKSALAFAGGFSDRAYTASINLLRNTPTQQQLTTIPTTDIAQFVPQGGDHYVVGTILDRVENKVSVSGAVFRPGDYALSKEGTLKQLITRAEGLREDAFLNRATIRRLRNNLDPEVISVDLGKLLRGEIADIALYREDHLHISTLGELRQQRSVSVQGAVNKSGTFDFADSMTVANLIVLAEGFSDAAISSRMEIARRVKTDTSGLPNDQNVRLIVFEIDQNLRLNPADAKLTLRPFDQVFVRASPRYEAQKGVSIAGEVVYPGGYAIRTKSDHITDLISRAGGLKPEAYLPAARFTRRGESISLDLKKILDDSAVAGNLLLEDGDVLTLPRRPDIIRIRGEVLNPATVEFDPAKSFRDYIGETGGFTNKALKRKAYAIGANGKIKPTRSLLGIRSYPTIERGADIVVPAVPSKEPDKGSSAERAAWLTVIASGVAVILTALRLITN